MGEKNNWEWPKRRSRGRDENKPQKSEEDKFEQFLPFQEDDYFEQFTNPGFNKTKSEQYKPLSNNTIRQRRTNLGGRRPFEPSPDFGQSSN